MTSVTVAPPPTVPAGATPSAALVAAMVGPLVDVEASGRSDCYGCPHPRRVHSRNGCEDQGCACTVTYMDLRGEPGPCAG